jgi:hypothetical protein
LRSVWCGIRACAGDKCRDDRPFFPRRRAVRIFPKLSTGRRPGKRIQEWDFVE